MRICNGVFVIYECCHQSYNRSNDQHMPAMGTITVSDNDCTIEKMLPFHVLGVCPTSAAIVPTLSFTSVNMPWRLDVIQPVSTSFMNSESRSITAGIAYEKSCAGKSCCQ